MHPVARRVGSVESHEMLRELRIKGLKSCEGPAGLGARWCRVRNLPSCSNDAAGIVRGTLN